MDRITKALLDDFAKEHGVSDLAEDKQFEHFSAFSMIRRHYSRNFNTEDVVLGGGGDTGIDAIAVIVNNSLVTEADQLDELHEVNAYLEPIFLFVQSDRGTSFEGAKLGNTGYGLIDFFSSAPKLTRSNQLQDIAEISDTIIAKFAASLRPARCFLYYVTTGLTAVSDDLLARKRSVENDLENLGIFSKVEVSYVGASELNQAYRNTRSPISRTFTFDHRTEIPATDGVIVSAIGYLPFSEFRKLLTDESGQELLTNIFDDNIRDYQDGRLVNKAIDKTLKSDDKAKFVLMNNGVTIIAKDLKTVTSKWTVTDYQIVNGCQTSNVLFQNKDVIDDNVLIPIRVIHTTDERIKDLITEATNSQTEIKPDQFASRLKFSRDLETLFPSFLDPYKLYYERRDGQFDRVSVPKGRIVEPSTVLRSYAAIFREAPHISTKNYRSIRDGIGSEYLVEGHKHLPYYYAAYAWFRLDQMFRSKAILPAYKASRYHILMAANLLINNGPKLYPNSAEIEKRSTAALNILQNDIKSSEIFAQAINIITEVTGGKLTSDVVRTEAVTNAIISKLRPRNI